MKSNSMTKQSVQFRVWDDNQCAEVVNAAYRVLERTGCSVHNEKARDLLKDAGCLVSGDRVRIPHALMEWAVNAAPSAFTLYDRCGKPAIKLEPFNSAFGTTCGDTYVVDLETGERRPGRKADSVASGLLCDAMPNVDWAASINMVSDGNDALASVYEMQAVLPNSTKPVMYWTQSMETLACQFEMFEAVAGGADELQAKPFIMNLNTPTDPLGHSQMGLDVQMYLAKKRSPVIYCAGVGMGVTAPIAPAAAAVVLLADTLVGLLVSQLTLEGAPFIAAAFKDNINFSTLTISHSGPEFQLANTATADVFRYLGLPFINNSGDTDTGQVDQVFILDHVVGVYAGALAGANLNFGGCACESANSSVLSGIVVYNDIIGYVKKLVEGVEVSDYAIQEDLIDKVGPGGNFVSEEHTLTHCRDNWKPAVLVPRTQEEWIAAGRRDLADIAAEVARDIVAKGPQNPLADDLVAELDAIVARAEENTPAA